MNLNDTRDAKIQSNLSRYEDWESRQNSKMDQAITEINGIFESMNYKVNKKMHKSKKQKPELIPQCRCTDTCVQRNDCKKFQLWKLANLFEFGQLSNRQKQVGCRSSSLSSAETLDNAQEQWYSYRTEIFKNKLESVNSVEENNTSQREPESDTMTNHYQNLLGIPPPQIVEPSLRTTRSASCDLRHSKQIQLLLHDLISGDICDN
ncbi:unnamed protein product [Kluyveromyces dobzhanskii CBS 2104]|uniref:WGS project CCBQ000000000 data, contig 00102 n=1 Tax=Kluyveromyces dobzhanskii CBS 2104 TaxID=1427455 RepID=A0A0A8L613_9SACH|nr:unnamed protein product [Kluyveromyces dobzhanskii CBS 2104]